MAQYKLVSMLLAAGCALSTAHAMGPLRCDGRLIDPGASAAYVLYQCGEPQITYTETGAARNAVPGGFTRPAGVYVSEVWVYERGFGRFPAELHFRDGVLRRIEYWKQRSERRAEAEAEPESNGQR